MGRIYEALTPVLFSFNGDTAQKLGETVYKLRPLWHAVGLTDKRYAQLKSNLAGIGIDNPIGLAAGYDKDCEFLDSMMDLGFGYVVGGTIFRHPRKGNPRPWIARHVKQKSLVNAMGFPSSGAEIAGKNLKRYSTRDKPIIGSMAALEMVEWAECLQIIEPLVDGIELNISSPNTTGLRTFQEPHNYRELLSRINHYRKKPLFVKMPRYEAGSFERLMEMVEISEDEGVDGLVAANTMPVAEQNVGTGHGGLSGREIFEKTVEMADYLAGRTKIPITACGGISTASDITRLAGKAKTFQLLTALVYEGPFIVRKIKKELALNDTE